MKAAIIGSYQRGPEYGDFEEPLAKTGEVIVNVRDDSDISLSCVDAG